MNRNNELIYRILRKIGLRSHEIESGRDFKDDLGLDSIEIIYMVNLLESKFNISIPDQDIPYLKNTPITVNYINKRVSA
ncbi:MAG: acyl carrier protein [Bacteroidetes bacterium]|nr:acyl carrier protein [Bacteroidota bacterium]